MTLFTPLPGLEMGMGLRGRVCVENNIFFGLKYDQDLKNWAAQH